MKNTIKIGDFARAAERRGADAQKAIYQACLLRLWPIVMTTMTTIVRSLPLALDTGAASAVRRSLGIVIIGGLITSQVLAPYMDRPIAGSGDNLMVGKIPHLAAKSSAG